MDLSAQAIHDVVHPTAAFASTTPSIEREHTPGPGPGPGSGQGPDWAWSPLNPKNRIDSLSMPARPLWRIDGCTGLGTQFYAVPLFGGLGESRPPQRVDVFIPEAARQPAGLRQALDLDVAFHTKDGCRVRALGIAAHLVRLLDRWVRRLDDPERLYRALPFGSRIVVSTLAPALADMSISVARTHALEVCLLPAQDLRRLWRLTADEPLPPLVDMADFHELERVHDSVSIVRLRTAASGAPLLVLKALNSSTRYLYHELRNLLATPAHPNVLGRPQHLVTKRCGFGAKRGVVGFTTLYHAGGTLREALPLLRAQGRLEPGQQLAWASQVAGALEHLQARAGLYYPDLRLDNVVVSGAGDAVLVDMEQRGVWCEFAAPEVNALEYVRMLAEDDAVPADHRARYAALLPGSAVPAGGAADAAGTGGAGRPERYDGDARGYNLAWLALTACEREAATVYQLGRVIWCIFEGVSAPQRSAVWQSYRFEPDLDFPAYRRTPPGLRRLVDACTRGHRAQLNSLVVRNGARLELRYGGCGGCGGAAGEAQIRCAARDWWAVEVAAAEQFLNVRVRLMRQGQWVENYYGRPSLRDVVGALEQFRLFSKSLSSSSVFRKLAKSGRVMVNPTLQSRAMHIMNQLDCSKLFERVCWGAQFSLL